MARLLNYVATVNHTASVHSPLTATLGLRMASQCTESIGGLYLHTGRDSETVCVLTACHVVFPHKDVQSSQRAAEVTVPGPEAFQRVLTFAMVKIAHDKVMVDQQQKQLGRLQMRDERGDTDSIDAGSGRAQFEGGGGVDQGAQQSPSGPATNATPRTEP